MARRPRPSRSKPGQEAALHRSRAVFLESVTYPSALPRLLTARIETVVAGLASGTRTKEQRG